MATRHFLLIAGAPQNAIFCLTSAPCTPKLQQGSAQKQLQEGRGERGNVFPLAVNYEVLLYVRQQDIEKYPALLRLGGLHGSSPRSELGHVRSCCSAWVFRMREVRLPCRRERRKHPLGLDEASTLYASGFSATDRVFRHLCVYTGIRAYAVHQ